MVNPRISVLPWVIVLVLLASMAVQLFTSAREKCATFDEWSILAGGLRYLETGENDVHIDIPAGIKAWIALPVCWVCSPKLPEDVDAYPWSYGNRFLEGLEDPSTVLLLARLPVMVMAILLAVYVFVFSRMLWGTWGGVLSLAVVCFEPNLLAHGRLATCDVALAALATGGFLFLWKALQTKRGIWHLLSALHLVLAMEAKFIGLVFLILALLVHVGDAVSRGGMRKGLIAGGMHAGRFLGIVGILYLFVVLFLYRGAPTAVSGYFHLAKHLDRGHPTFFLGRFDASGWWYFHPFTLLVKSPLPVLLGVLLLPLVVRGRTAWRRLVLLCTVGGGWIAASMTSPVCLGVRHMLFPIAIGATGLGYLVQRSAPRLRALGLGLGLAWLVTGTLLNHPHHLAFFNEAAGGREGGRALLVDSNLDWGQDLPALARWLDHRGSPPVVMIYFGNENPGRFGICYRGWVTRPEVPDCWDLESGYLVVSATYQVTAPINPGLKAFLSRCDPIETLGGSLLVYRIRPEKRF